VRRVHAVRRTEGGMSVFPARRSELDEAAAFVERALARPAARGAIRVVVVPAPGLTGEALLAAFEDEEVASFWSASNGESLAGGGGGGWGRGGGGKGRGRRRWSAGAGRSMGGSRWWQRRG